METEASILPADKEYLTYYYYHSKLADMVDIDTYRLLKKASTKSLETRQRGDYKRKKNNKFLEPLDAPFQVYSFFSMQFYLPQDNYLKGRLEGAVTEEISLCE